MLEALGNRLLSILHVQYSKLSEKLISMVVSICLPSLLCLYSVTAAWKVATNRNERVICLQFCDRFSCSYE